MSTRAHRVFLAALLALAALFVTAQVVRSVEPLALDQALFACFTRFVPRGLLPYRDLFDSKPPLFLYSYALANLLPGGLVRAIWLLESLWLLATMALAFVLARRVWDRWAGLGAAALVFVAEWTPGWGGWWSRAQADEFVALPLLGAALLAWRAIDDERLAVWAGVLTGVAGLFKVPSMAVAAAWPLTWLLVAGARPALRRTLAMTLGLFAPWLLASAWFAAHGAFGAFIDGVFVYHRYNAAFIAPPWSEVVPEFVRTLVVAGAAPLAAAAVGLAFAAPKERIWLGTWIATTTLAVMLERQLAGYQYLLAMPAFAVAGGFGVARIVRDRRRAIVAVGLAGLCALVALEAVRWTRAYGPDARALGGAITRDEFLAGFEGTFSPATEEQAARWLDEHSAPGDGILVWGLSPGIYALADRHPVTRYPFHKVLLTDAPFSQLMPGLDVRRADFFRRLAADPPAFVLVGHRDRNGFEPDDSFRSMMKLPELQALLRDHYAPVTEIGRFMVLQRR
ncbi:MAG TPA: glycosyltransferase family 39 protein [Polyangia bacterium]|jgi:hypothetical protein